MTFVELTLQDGRKLDVPPYAIQFVEGLDPGAREQCEGCVAGLFFDVGGEQPQPGGGFGHGTLQSAVVRETYETIAAAVREHSPGARVELETALGQPVMLECDRIVSLQDSPADHANGGKCNVKHRVGSRVLPLDVVQTRDEIRSAMAAACAPPDGLQIIEPETKG